MCKVQRYAHQLKWKMSASFIGIAEHGYNIKLCMENLRQ